MRGTHQPQGNAGLQDPGYGCGKGRGCAGGAAGALAYHKGSGGGPRTFL